MKALHNHHSTEMRSDYFLCTSRDVPLLVEKAKREAKRILEEFSLFYTGNIDIAIGINRHGMGWSITGTLTVNGVIVAYEDPCDLLFLSLNTLMLAQMLKSGMISFSKNESDAEERG